MINVRLPWPPTVNTYYTIARNRKILSAKGRMYKIDGSVLLLQQKAPRGISGRLEVRIEAYPPDRRKRDIDNVLKPLIDTLGDYGLFLDDEQIDILSIRRNAIEKPGYVRIHIFKIGEEA